MKAVTDTQHYDGIANAINYSKDNTETYTPSQLASEAQTLAENYRGAVSEIEDTREGIARVQTTVDEINSKVNGVSLNNVGIAVTDFLNDEITIISGGLESIERIITT